MTSQETIDSFRGEHRFLSNFWILSSSIRPTIQTYFGPAPHVEATTVEHLYEAYKATNLKDFLYVINSDTAGVAKRRGREISARPGWDRIKIPVMRYALRLKFLLPNEHDLLLGTGQAHLIEGNTWHDNFWGSCRCVTCKNTGKNQLGKMIEAIREELTGTVRLPLFRSDHVRP